MLQHHRRRSIGSGVALALAVGGLALGACGKGDSSRDEIAKAFAGPPPKDDKKEVEAKMKALKEKADADAEKARTDELERITTVSAAQLPELEAGCIDAGAALDEFRQKRLADAPDELARWNATKEPDLRKVVDACKASGKPEVAACQASAFRGASIAHFGLEGSTELVEHCNQRYGGAPAGAAPDGKAPPAVQ